MEMKYLTEQDTGQIYLPRVHISSIVDLDVSGNASVKTTNVSFTDGAVGITRGVLRFNEYNKVVVAQIIMEIDYTNTGINCIYPLLLAGAGFTIDINDPGLGTYTYMVFDTISYDVRGAMDARIDTSISYNNGLLIIKSSLKDRNYYINDAGEVTETPYNLSFQKVVGTAVGFALV